MEAEPVCATGLRMMPSARVEVLVGDPGGGLVGRFPVAQAPGQAVLRTAVYSAGDDPANAGNNWPRIGLAAVTFAPAAVSAPAPGAGVVATAPTALRVRGQRAAALLQPGGALVAAPTLLVPGADQPVGIASARGMARPDTPPPVGLTSAPTGGANAISAESALGLSPDPRCKALPAGHRRRVFFGKLAAETDTFGLGYKEVDAKGAVVPGTE